MLQILESAAADLETALSALLDTSDLYDINLDDPGGLTIVGACNFWSPLAIDAQPLLRAAREALNAWTELSIPAVVVGDKWKQAEFTSAMKRFDQIVDRSARAEGLWESSVDDIRTAAGAALSDQLTTIRALGEGGSTDVTWLPDTNAVIFQPDLSQWPDTEVTILVTPPVLSELDNLKEGREGAERAAKASAAIGSLNEMGRRGDTLKGVRVHGRLRLREVAVDPDMARAPSWLRSDSVDDRLIASALELSYRELAAPLMLVTRDRNLKNKARLARLACSEPGDLGVTAAVPAARVAAPVLDAVFQEGTLTGEGGDRTQLLEIVNLTEKPLRIDRVNASPPAWMAVQPQTLAGKERKRFPLQLQRMSVSSCTDLDILATPQGGNQVTWSRRYILGVDGLQAER